MKTYSKETRVADPIDLHVLASPSIEAGAPSRPCTAMIVCHGMGQQVPFETLDAVATAITDEHMGEDSGIRSVEVVLRFVRPTGSEKLFPRAEITLKQSGQEDRTIHLYEAYWAPLTEGVISYTQTVWHLMRVGLSGLKESIRGVFHRWMFGSEKALPLDRDTFRLLLLTVLIAVPVMLLPLIGWNIYGYVTEGKSISLTCKATLLLVTLLWAWASFKIRQWIIQFMGDVIVYVSSNEVNGYWKIRDEIKQIGLALARVVYGAVDSKVGSSSDTPPRFLYSNVVVVGHSLGSVVAYDTLNGVINQDLLEGGARKVVQRTGAFITLGSPLDKIAFLFRLKAKEAFARDVLSAAYQPMILDYKYRPRWWINVFCRRDAISGRLEYYDDPEQVDTESRRVLNYQDPYWLPNPVSAHTDYWKRPMAQSFLYRAATDQLELATRQHSSRHQKIRRA